MQKAESNKMKNIFNYLKARLNKVFSTQNANEFYYMDEQMKYQASIEHSRVRFMTSLDKAA